MIPRGRFNQQVRDALTNLYDPAHLETHPLLNLLIDGSVPAETRGTQLRELLVDTIEKLRPDASLPYGRPEWLPYRILYARYVEGLHPSTIAQELCVGHTSFYEHHRKALDAVANLLWERYQHVGQSSDAEPEGDDRLAQFRQVREEAVAMARLSPRQPTRWAEVLDRVRQTIMPFAEQEAVALQIDAPDDLPIVHADPTVLRQILCNVLSELIQLCPAGHLHLTGRVENEEVMWRLEGLGEAGLGVEHLDRIPGLIVAQGLLDAYGGRLWLEAGAEPALTFTVPAGRPPTILLIDDNAETVHLYQRYLQARHYVVNVASDSGAVHRCLGATLPDLILLDVLMPDEDGWSLLQTLRTLPETSRIPVVICSVLSQPGLALALGAQAVLQKPVKQDELLQTLEALLDPRGSRAPGR